MNENEKNNEVLKTPKPKNGLVIGLSTAVVVLAGLLGFTIWKLSGTDEVKKKPKKPDAPVVEKEMVDVSLEDELVKEAAKFSPNYLCGGSAITLTKGNRDISDFTTLEKFNMMISLYGDSVLKATGSGTTFTIKEDELYRYFADISFMDTIKPSIDAASSGGGSESNIANNMILPIYLNYDNGVYTIGGYGTGCVGPLNDSDYLRLKAAKKDDEKLVLTFVHYYSKAEYDNDTDGFTYYFYRDKSESEYVEKIDYTEYENHSFDNEKYEKYEMTLNIKDNKLQLVSFNYVG